MKTISTHRRNLVAKFSGKFNKAKTFLDRKKQAKKTGVYNKHQTKYTDGDNT
jgi:hypothetical protein|tara:strand:- start:521 stop:676 length:156 start_codon:yes stop_codon:yes gene_type:complete